MIGLQKIIIRFLLGLYVLAIFKPLFPYFEYALNKSFIVQQLCENRTKPELDCEGVCYLSKRLAQTENPQAAQTAPVPVKPHFEQDSHHLRQNVDAGATLLDLNILPKLVSETRFFPPFVADIFHPPRTSLI